MLAWVTATGLKWRKKSSKCGINIYSVQRCSRLNGVSMITSPIGNGDMTEFQKSFASISKFFHLYIYIYIYIYETMSFECKCIIQGLNHKTTYLWMCGSLRAGLSDEQAGQQIKVEWSEICFQIQVFHKLKNSSEIYPQFGLKTVLQPCSRPTKFKECKFELVAKILDWQECRPARGVHMSRGGPGFICVTIVTATGKGFWDDVEAT